MGHHSAYVSKDPHYYHLLLLLSQDRLEKYGFQVNLKEGVLLKVEIFKNL